MKIGILHLPCGQLAQHFPFVWLAGIGFGQGGGEQRTSLQSVWFSVPRESRDNPSYQQPQIHIPDQLHNCNKFATI